MQLCFLQSFEEKCVCNANLMCARVWMYGCVSFKLNIISYRTSRKISVKRWENPREFDKQQQLQWKQTQICIKFCIIIFALTIKCRTSAAAVAASYQIGRLNMELIHPRAMHTHTNSIVYISLRVIKYTYALGIFDAWLFTRLQMQFVKLFPFDENAEMRSHPKYVYICTYGTWRQPICGNCKRSETSHMQCKVRWVKPLRIY